MIIGIQKRYFLTIMLLTGIGYAAQSDEEFIVKKDKKNGASTSHMKEEIGQQLFETFEQLTTTLELLAQVQKQLIHASRSILDEQCLNGCKKQKLNTLCEKVHIVQIEAHEIIKHAEQLLPKTQSFVQTLHKE